MKNGSGFTLLELLLAIALLAALSAAAVPGYQRALAGWRLNAAARQVAMDLKLTRARALLDAAPHRLHFAVPGQSYQHERQRPGGAYESVGPPIELPADVDVIGCTGAGAGISFRPRGIAATFGTVALRSRDGGERDVVVDIAGRMRVQ